MIFSKRVDYDFPKLEGGVVQSKDIPSWVDNQKYKTLECDDFISWYVLLRQRVIAKLALDSRAQVISDALARDKNSKIVGEGFNQFSSFGVGKNLDLEVDKSVFPITQTKSSFIEKSANEAKSSLFKLEELSVRPISLGELQYIEEDLHFSGRIYKNSDLDAYDLFAEKKSEILFGEESCELADLPYNEELLIIDSSRPERELIREFKSYVELLKSKRLKKDLRGNLKDNNKFILEQKIYEIRKLGVLPFIDLWLWGTIENKKITQQQMHAKIMCRKDGFELGDWSYINKRVRPLAETLFLGSFMSCLKLEALKETSNSYNKE